MTTCFHGDVCERCPCVQRAIRGERDPCEHGGACIAGCNHVAAAQQRPEIRELIDARECMEICAL